MTGIYAVLDTVSSSLFGGLHLHKADAAAVRMFTDALTDERTLIAKHPADFDLICLGYVCEVTVPENGDRLGIPAGGISTQGITLVLAGKQWLASQPPKDAQ